MKRRTFVWLGLLTALMLLATAATVGSTAFAIAALVAILPLPIYIAGALWLDRFEPEPRGMLAMAFLWGASVAVLLSGMVNETMDAAIGEQMSTVVSAPLVEECLKAVILIRIYTSRKYEFDGVIDGIIYASMVGLGFAFAENLDYYGRALATDGLGGLALTFTLRGVMAPFSHPMFTAMTGLGLGLARQTRRRWVRIVAPVAGLGGALLLHSAWNAGASAGCVFFAVYALVMMPALAGLLVVAGFALRREGRLIREQLEREAKLGVLSADDYVQLSSVRGRLHASVDAFRRGRLSGWRQRRAFHQAASELAFLRHRVASGDQQPDPDLEASYVNLLATLAARPPAAGITPS
jgi:RsiW-degrading membrane proteinase PrsW (M82 family)